MFTNPIDEWYFSGDQEMNNTLDTTAVSNQSSSYPEIRGGVVRFTSATHGFKVSPDIYGPKPGNLILIQGSTNYDAMRKIVAVAANTFDVIATYVAETPAGTEVICPGFKFGHDVEFLGFELNLSSASATSELLTVDLDADRGSEWDHRLYSKDMNTYDELEKFFSSNPVESGPVIKANDAVKFSWANTNDRTWYLKIFTRRLF